jgi:hypothetical protein
VERLVSDEIKYVTAETAKAKAPLDLLCHHLGIELGWDDHARCPFHDDNDPSFYIWYGSSGEQLWWCMPCGFGGDQVDLVRRVKGLGFTEAVVELDRIAGELPSQVRRVRRPRDPEADAATLASVVADAQARAAESELDGYISAYAVGFVGEADADQRFGWDAFLRGLGWGIDDLGRVIMPHWAADGTLTGAKIRRVDGSRAAVPGSTFRQLYPAWWAPTGTGVVLTEGETDFAWAAWQAAAGGLSVDVRSIPRGAPGLSDPLSEDDTALVAALAPWTTVWLAFDNDDTGRAAVERWWNALHAAGHPDVRVAWPRDGADLRSDGRPLADMLA